MKEEDSRTEVTYECGSDGNFGWSNGVICNTLNNNCTLPEGVSANPDDWTDFNKTETYEAVAFNAHLGMMGDRFQWLHELGDAYKSLVQNLTKHQPLAHEAILLIQTCMTCRTELITAFRALSRGYPRDCRLKTRLAVEYAIFAARAVEKPDSVPIWLAAGNSEADWKRYRENFKIFYLLEEKSWKVLSALKPQILRLADDYAHLSQFTHATVFSAGTEVSDGELTFKGAFVERFSDEDFLSLFAELLDIHLNVIDLMLELLNFLTIEIDSETTELVRLLKTDIDSLFAELEKTEEIDETADRSCQDSN